MPTERPNEPRNNEIVKRYMSGETLRALGRVYGISGERVRQLVKRAGAWRPGGPGGPPKLARITLTCLRAGCDRTFVVKSTNWLNQRFCSRSCGKRRLNDADMLSALRALATKIGRTPTQGDMNADKATPSHWSYVNHFGSTRKAQKAAGLVPNVRGAAGHIR